MVGGDRLTIDVALGPGAHGVITTPASGKVYRSGGPLATQSIALRAASGSTLEWLPQDTIVYEGALANLSTRVQLSPEADFIGWDILCLGRPASGELFRRGRLRQRFELWLDGSPLFIERATFDGGPVQDAAWGLGGAPVHGMLLAVASAPSTIATRPVRDALFRLGAVLPAPDLTSVSLVGTALVCRYLGESAQRAREHFTRLWTWLRPLMLGRPACPPRIWST
jgi:urease accessory protein